MDRQAHWEEVYAHKQDLDTSWFQVRPDVSLSLIERTGVADGARIVDVGGGTSRLVDHLYRRFRVTVLDISANALERAKARLGGAAGLVEWLATDVTRWQPACAVQCWHDRAVFHFLVEEVDRRAYAAAMAAAVEVGGQAIVGTFAIDGPERCSGLPVQRYDATAMAAEFAGSFDLIDSCRHEHITPGGKLQQFQFCRFLRR